MTGEAKSVDRNCHSRTRAQSVGVTLSVRNLQPLLMYLTARGEDTSAFLRAQGLDPQIFRDPEARVSHSVAVPLWPAAMRLTNDPDLGLHVAEGVRPGNYGVLDYAVRTSETMGIGLQRLCRYHRFLHDVAGGKARGRG